MKPADAVGALILFGCTVALGALTEGCDDGTHADGTKGGFCCPGMGQIAVGWSDPCSISGAPACQQGLFCGSDNVCQDRIREGGACSGGLPCQQGLFCSVDSVCERVMVIVDGGTCTGATSQVCAPGLACAAGGFTLFPGLGNGSCEPCASIPHPGFDPACLANAADASE
jgi:hypothetical protein